MDDNNFYELMGFLRFTKVTDTDTLILLEKISGIKKNDEPYKPTRTPPVNLKLEIASWKLLHKLCIDSLKNFPTTIDEDY